MPSVRTDNKVQPKSAGKKKSKNKFKAAWESLVASDDEKGKPPNKPKDRRFLAEVVNEDDTGSEVSFDGDRSRSYAFTPSPNASSRFQRHERGYDQVDPSRSLDSSTHASLARSFDNAQRLNQSRSQLNTSRSMEEFNPDYLSASQSSFNLKDYMNDAQKGSCVVNPTQPPVYHRLVAMIQGDMYVDFRDLLPEYRSSPLGNTGKDLLENDGRVDDIVRWIDCMTIYTSVYTQVHPKRIWDLLAYQLNVTRLFKESPDQRAWQRYDVAFRRKAAQSGIKDWSGVDEQLLVLAMSRDGRKGITCKPCLSFSHPPNSCPFNPKPIPKKSPLDREPEEKPAKRNQWKMSSKPTKYSVPKSPNVAAKMQRSSSSGKPKEGLDLKFAFGYHGYDACNNVFYTKDNDVVFHIAAVGVVYNPGAHRQNFYRGHTDDILCLTVRDQQDYAATGQVGKNAETHVWDISTQKTIAILKGFHRRGVIIIDFSGDGKKLADVGMDDDHCICIWDWQKQEQLANTRGHKDMVYDLEWNSSNSNYFVTVGVKHIKFWTLNGKKIDKRPVTFGKAGKVATMWCVCHSPYEDLTFSGSESGEISVWQGTTYRRSIQGHKGPVYTMFSLSQTKSEGFVTGGGDGVVVLWNRHFDQCLHVFKIESSNLTPGSVLTQDLPPIRSIHTDEGKVLVGTGNCEIVEIGTDGKMTVLVQGHGDGEIWGLAVHPHDDEFATVSDDKTLRIWDLLRFRMKKFVKLRKGGRCVDFSPDGLTLAVGQNDGSVIIMETSTLKKVVNFKDRKEMISDIKFSPDGKFLAVGSHDNFVDIYSVKTGRRLGVCKGSSSYITHIDWDIKGDLIQTNSGAREHLFYEAPKARRKTVTYEAMLNIDWATYTTVLGPEVKGIFPPLSDITDVNATCRTLDQKLIATADDFGAVKLFNFPVMTHGARSRSYQGHCSHVTNVKWNYDDKFLVSVGGRDTSILVWERVKAHDDDGEDQGETGVFVQPKFMPTGPIKNPLSKGKSLFD